ncbi:hypothetical protein AAFC00_006682 [Neodothiora populina]
MARGPIIVDTTVAVPSDKHTEPHGFPNYLTYAEETGQIFELDAADAAQERGCLVQRIKCILEDKVQPKSPSAGALISRQASGNVKPMYAALGDENSKLSENPATSISPNVIRQHQALQPIELPAFRTSVDAPIDLEPSANLTYALSKTNTVPASAHVTGISEAVQSENLSVALPEVRRLDLESEARECEEDNRTDGGQLPTRHVSRPSQKVPKVAEDHVEGTTSDWAISGDIIAPGQSNIADGLAETDHHDQSQTSLDGPVSPLGPGERATRDSLVSPFVSQTDPVLAMSDDPRLSGSLPEERAATPSPRSRPLSEQWNSELSIQRFSLPYDLSLLNDQDTGSEIVTDVAVRMSVPSTADHGKPRMIGLATNVDFLPRRAEDATERLIDLNSTRESLFRVEKISPLQIRKCDAPIVNQDNPRSTDLSSFIRRSFPRRQSIWPNDHTDPTRTLKDLRNADLRYPGMSSSPGHLPGLKEDSQEDISIKGHRSSSSGLGLTMPSLIHPKQSLETSRRVEGLSPASYLPARAPRMTLAELRNIPSLNFSRLDLIGKLNDALVSCTSETTDIARGRKSASIHCPFPLRPSSTEALRERYASFFDKPDDFQVPEQFYGDPSESEDAAIDVAKESSGFMDCESSDLLAHYEVTNSAGHTERPSSLNGARSQSIWTRNSSSRPMSGPLSADELLSLTRDANRLSVPSVAALSERLSAWLPSIKHLTFGSAIANDQAVRETLDEIHFLGNPPDSEGLARSSTGLRQLAAMAEDIVTNGTHDSTALERKRTPKTSQELPPLPEDIEGLPYSDIEQDANTTTLGTSTKSACSVSELQSRKSALLRVRSLNGIDNEMHYGYPASADITPMGPITHHSRPWNLDENYPWNSKTLDIDIDFPDPILRRNTSASTILRRSRISYEERGDNTNVEDTCGTARASSSLASRLPIWHEASTMAEPAIETRGVSKSSLIGSISRKIGLTSYRTKSGLRISIVPETSNKAGDRYRSTALIPHIALNLDEVCSFFSDSTSNSSEKRRSFRKHINALRSRLPGGFPNLSTSRLHSLDAERTRSLDYRARFSQTACSASLFDDRFSEREHQPTYEGFVGMGKVEFRVKRVTERLKLVLWKTGHMIRTLSHKRDPAIVRSHKERERAQWLDDSSYSGT